MAQKKNTKEMQGMIMFVRNELKKNSQYNYPECMVNAVAEIFLKVEENRRIAVRTEDDCIFCYSPDNGEVFGEVRNPNYTNPKRGFIDIKQEKDRLYSEIKGFAELPDDVLYNHNRCDEYMLLTIDEMIEELGRMNKSLGARGQIKLNDCDIRSTEIKGNKYYRVTFHHENAYTRTPSRVEAVFGHFVHGFTYIFKADAFNANKDRILACVEHNETELGKNTILDFEGVAYDKKKKKKKKGKKGRKVARKHKEGDV